LRTLTPEVPPAVERIVNKCLAASAAARYPTANEVATDLEALDDRGREQTIGRGRLTWTRIAVIALIAALLIVATWWFASRRATPVPAAHAPVPAPSAENTLL
jgi:hypothetical protein